MTLAELETKRAEIVASLGIARITFGERSIEYSRQAEALAAVDREIARLQQAGEPRVFVPRASRGLD